MIFDFWFLTQFILKSRNHSKILLKLQFTQCLNWKKRCQCLKKTACIACMYSKTQIRGYKRLIRNTKYEFMCTKWYLPGFVMTIWQVRVHIQLLSYKPRPHVVPNKTVVKCSASCWIREPISYPCLTISTQWIITKWQCQLISNSSQLDGYLYHWPNSSTDFTLITQNIFCLLPRVFLVTEIVLVLCVQVLRVSISEYSVVTYSTGAVNGSFRDRYPQFSLWCSKNWKMPQSNMFSYQCPCYSV